MDKPSICPQPTRSKKAANTKTTLRRPAPSSMSTWVGTPRAPPTGNNSCRRKVTFRSSKLTISSRAPRAKSMIFRPQLALKRNWKNRRTSKNACHRSCPPSRRATATSSPPYLSCTKGRKATLPESRIAASTSAR